MTYRQLIAKLSEMGINEKEANIANKLARGKFSVAFMVQCLEAIEVSDLIL